MAVAFPQHRKDWIWFTWSSWRSCDTCCRLNLLAFFKRLHFSVWALSRLDPAGLRDESSLLIPAHRESSVSSNYFLINVHLASLHCFDKQKPCIVPCSPLKACISFSPATLHRVNILQVCCSRSLCHDLLSPEQPLSCHCWTLGIENREQRVERESIQERYK